MGVKADVPAALENPLFFFHQPNWGNWLVENMHFCKFWYIKKRWTLPFIKRLVFQSSTPLDLPGLTWEDSYVFCDVMRWRFRKTGTYEMDAELCLPTEEWLSIVVSSPCSTTNADKYAKLILATLQMME